MGYAEALGGLTFNLALMSNDRLLQEDPEDAARQPWLLRYVHDALLGPTKTSQLLLSFETGRPFALAHIGLQRAKDSMESVRPDLATKPGRVEAEIGNLLGCAVYASARMTQMAKAEGSRSNGPEIG